MSEHTRTGRGPRPQPVLEGFPRPGRRVEHAYRELNVALYGDDNEKKALGNSAALARPWDPPTCVDPELRAEVWDWLDRVATWINHEYVWDPTAMIPPCWPKHPHLVHEIAVIADLRRRAGLALTSEALEEWHRYALPAFTDRMRQRLKAQCEDQDHQTWPAQGRHKRHLAQSAVDERGRHFQNDLNTLTDAPVPPEARTPRLRLVNDDQVDLITGETLD
ncbi:hypothetical protein KMZ32_06205 [Phycicoccus sp. MAQZ13P-2]|uniref:hypothetical protein n=1 Tax=Phycicoccus TaxID=367298 RepID=UPI001C007EB1|nr:hypothetical protein [Phycicoccus mangrovi]MBT9273665.1 hypothetical protein [Phycicoccus mangrovi]